jgi:uncharacterized membrane protein YqjE
MATCPHCKGHLTDSHKCPRRPAVVGIEIALAGVAGGLVALLIIAVIDPQGRLSNIDAGAVVLGALAAIGLNRVLRH